ncbi:MAG: hypothetical protein R6U13_12630, partial [Desulfatiglandaceae bacterium]
MFAHGKKRCLKNSRYQRRHIGEIDYVYDNDKDIRFADNDLTSSRIKAVEGVSMREIHRGELRNMKLPQR